MRCGPTRRAAAAGLGAALLPAAAMAEPPAARREGTWGGASGDLSAQVILSGGQLIGFYFDDDYKDTGPLSVAPDGRAVRFDFSGGRAVLTFTGETTATLEVWRGGQHVVLALKRD